MGRPFRTAETRRLLAASFAEHLQICDGHVTVLSGIILGLFFGFFLGSMYGSIVDRARNRDFVP